MRSENPTASASLLTAVRGRAERAGRYVAQRPPAMRGLLVVLAAAVLALPLAWAASSVGLVPGVLSTSPQGAFLAGGHAYSNDDRAVITRALDLKRISYRVDDQGHVIVDADRRAEASEIIAKLAVGPRSVRDLVREAITPSLLESPGDSERKREVFETQVVEELIKRNRDIVDAYIDVRKTKPQLGARRAVVESAFVRLETRGDRVLDAATIDSIIIHLRGHWVELKLNAITIIDQTGRIYHDPTDMARSALARTASRQDEIRRQLLDQLDWIKGVRVSVRMISPPASVPAPPAVPIIAGASPATASGGSFSSREHATRATAIVANRPIDLNDGDDSPIASPVPVRSTSGAGTEVSPIAPTVETAPEHGTIWVKVPRGYYWNAVRSVPGRDHDPSVEELRNTAARVESQIREMAGGVVSLGELWELKIDAIPDEPDLSRPTAAPTSSNSRPITDWQTPLAAGGAALAVVLFAFGARAAAGRRMPAQAVRGGYRVDAPASKVSEPGPSDRVRELVRLNTAAAAGVVERWISQGGRSE